MDEDRLRQRVAAERQLRGYFSVRAAALTATDYGARISYTTWNDWESGKRPLGDVMRRAVMVLFDWPYDWPTNPPGPDEPGPAAQAARPTGRRPMAGFAEAIEVALAPVRAEIAALSVRVAQLEGGRHLRAADSDTGEIPPATISGERFNRPMPPPMDSDQAD